MKTCSKGHEYTTLKCSVCAKAYADANKEHIAAYNKAWREENAEKVSVKKKAYREENKAKIAAYNKTWQAANRSIVAEERKEYHKTNKARIAKKNKIWRETNPETQRTLNAKRRAAKLRQTPSWYSHADCKAIYKELKPGYHIDHIVPLQGKNVSGLHWHHNLQLLPVTENMTKHNNFDPDTYTHELPVY